MRIPDFFEAVLTDSVFNPTGIGLRSFGVNACGDKLLGKEAVTLVDFFGYLAAHIGQMEKMCIRDRLSTGSKEHGKP